MTTPCFSKVGNSAGTAHLLCLGVRVGRRVVAGRRGLVVAGGRGLLVGRRGLRVAAQLDGAFAPGGRHHVTAGAIWVRGHRWWERQGRVRWWYGSLRGTAALADEQVQVRSLAVLSG